MPELIAAVIFYVATLIPWSSPFLISISLIISFCSMLYFCLALIDRLYIRGKVGHRIDMDKAPDPFGNMEDDTADLPYDRPLSNTQQQRTAGNVRREINYGRDE